MVLLAEELLVLKAETAAVYPKLRLKVVAVVLISLDVEVPMLPAKLDRLRLLVVSVVEEDWVMLPAPVVKLTDCIDAFPRLFVIAIPFELPRSTPMVRL